MSLANWALPAFPRIVVRIRLVGPTGIRCISPPLSMR